ncbi:MAG: dihydrodipicolinate reductase [Desulfosarcinaceae bacterium]|nr:dihydrodipicolinate reductase [Desulfosarcinaceae bacterium]
MSPIKMMMNGLPGKVSATIATHAISHPQIELLPYALTGPEIEGSETRLGDTTITLVKPERRDTLVSELKRTYGDFICVDFTHPSAVNDNAEFYCAQQLPFVMGTTGGDRVKLQQTVEASSIPAVIAPNMAKQIVGLQAMMAYGGEQFPTLFRGYQMRLEESHQQGKADTSGTAKAMVTYFNQMGIEFDTDQIVQVRDPEVQRREWGIPEAHLGGHGWHTYTLTSSDGTVTFQIRHNVNGRDVYAEGTFDAVLFLAGQVAAGVSGRVYSMIDVLRQPPV